MKHWFKDQQLRSLLKNTGYLGASRVVAALCGIATLALAGRSLGVLLLGTLILITSYAKAISGIAKFQSWQLIVRYGGHGVAHGDPEHFKVATGFAFSLDLVSGIAGMLIAVALLPLSLINNSEPTRLGMIWYAVLCL
jgi:O-antigen/teichoic acid export membrane protein